MAETVLRARLPASTTVTSAGLHADGRGPDPLAVEAVTELGLVPDVRPSRHVQAADVAGADLVLGLALHHVRDVVVLDRRAFGRTFALAELVARAADGSAREDGESLEAWLARMHEGRAASDLLASMSPFDVPDPTGGPRSGYLATARTLDDLAVALSRALRLDVEGDVIRSMPPGPRTERPPALPVIDVVADTSSLVSAQAVAHRLGRFGASHTVEGWEQAGRRAQDLSGRPGGVVLTLTTEPQGTAMIANRDPGTRAVVVTDPGMVTRTRRHLGANVVCIPSALEPAALASVAEALWSTVASSEGPGAR